MDLLMLHLGCCIVAAANTGLFNREREELTLYHFPTAPNFPHLLITLSKVKTHFTATLLVIGKLQLIYLSLFIY